MRTLRHLLDGRLFEWTNSVGSVWLAVAIWFWPETVQIGAFRHMTDVMTPDTLSLYGLVVGFVGSVALASNGVSLVVSPLVRAACAVARAFLCGHLAYSLWLLGQSQSASSLGLGYWILFTLSELYVAHRATMDAAVGNVRKDIQSSL